MRAYFNIGLNVNGSEPRAQLGRTLRALSVYMEPVAVATGEGEWEGTRERFIQVLGDVDAGMVDNTAARLARVLSQDCVAVSREYDARWYLADSKGGLTEGGSRAEFPIIVKE